MQDRVWREVNLNNIKSNFELIKEKAKGSKICCVIKDNAYGHGALRLAKFYEELKADYFAVSNLNEALELRDGGIETQILILGYTSVEFAKVLNEKAITQCVYSLDYAKELNKQNIKVKCHLKIDSGMNRIGFKDIDEMEEACKLPNLYFEGVFTHFALSEEEEFTKQQFDTFMSFIGELDSRGIEFDIRHCANSGSLFRYHEYNLDMVRPGIVLYGLGGYKGLKQALKLKSIISHIKTVHKGETIGYNRCFTAKNDIRVATVPIGYGDGYLRINSGKNTINVNGKEANILGNICMDQLMIDVSDIECNVLDVVTIYGDLEKIAANIDTISYELICSIDNRVPVIYKIED